jgi:hypothetical protein
MRSIVRKSLVALIAVAVSPVVFAATAHADNVPLYFSAAGVNCFIAGDGTLGCDFGSPQRLTYKVGNTDIPMLFNTRTMVIDQLPLLAHPSLDPGLRYSRAGGNPTIDDVKTGQNPWGSFVDYAGAHCEVGFHGSFSCTSKGQNFTLWNGAITA